VGSFIPRSLHIAATVKVNQIIWIRSLPSDDEGLSRRITHDLEDLSADEGGLPLRQIAVGHRQAFEAELDRIATEASASARPIIHFDCHGSPTKGLRLAPSGDFVPWDALAEKLRQIDVATGNNLCCFFAACFGLHIALEFDLSLPSPFFLAIGPEGKIELGYLEDRTVPFYRSVNESKNIGRSHLKVLAPEMQLFHCKEILAKGLATYINQYGRGKILAQRRERVVSRGLEKRGIKNPTSADLREARSRSKSLRVTQRTIDHYAKTFLLGRKAGFGITELKELAAGMRRSGSPRNLR